MGQFEPENNYSEAIALNQALIGELKSKGLIQTPGIEIAFLAVLRHHFLPGKPLEEVYSDRAIAAKQDQNGQWISSSSQPAIMAIMLEQLGLRPGHRVLEIGAGTGYNAALMATIVGETGQVVTIDIDEDLAEAAREHLQTAGFGQVQVFCADGWYGFPDAAPFDRIILTVGAPDIAPAWWEQLKPDGRLVLPLMLKGSMKSIAFEQDNDHLKSISVRECSFMPLRGEFASGFSSRIQLGQEQGLYLEPAGQFAIDSDAAFEFLAGPRQDWATGVEVTVWDVMVGELWTWLALQEPRLCKLAAEGEVVEHNIVPPVSGIDGKQKYTGTVALVEKTGLAALTRPPDQPVHLVERDKLFLPDSPFVVPFMLFVRQFGPDETIAKRLVSQIQAWSAAGRPSSEGMHIRAYRVNSAHTPSEGEYVIEKPWTKLVLEWPAVV